MAVGLRVRPIEELALRRQGETAVGYKVAPIPLPLPSTFAGALAAAGWARNPGCSRGLGRVERARNCIRALGLDVEYLRGPYLTNSCGVYIWAWDKLIRLDTGLIRGWLEHQREGMAPGKRAYREMKAEEAERYRALVYTPEQVHRPGVRLDREHKVVHEEGGALFSVPYVGYRVDRGDTVLYEAFGEGGLSGAVPVRLGGEQRMALIEQAEPTVYRLLEAEWGGRTGGEALLVVGSPLLIDSFGEDPHQLFLQAIEGLDPVESAHEIYSVHPEARHQVAPIYPGFDEVKGVKEKYRLALLPGAAIQAHIRDWRAVYREGAGEYREIGYGTLLPIPIK